MGDEYLNALLGFTQNPNPRPLAFKQSGFMPTPSSESGGGFMNWMKNSGMLDSVDLNTNNKTQGWGGLALGAGSALMNGFMGMQNYGLARAQFNESKDQFNRNFAATQKTTNTALEDRQRSRVNSSVSGAYQSVGDYMDKNRI